MPPYTLNRLRSIATKASNPLKVLNYIGIRAALIMKPDRVPFLPPRIEVEPINTCNLKCRHCQVPHWSKPPSVLGKSNFKSILDQFPNLLSVKLQGMGEPLLNRELLEMLSEGERRGLAMEFFTNGTVLTHDHVNRLIKLRKTNIIFSVDGATAETFESIRYGASFEKVVGNIRRLVQARGKKTMPSISLATVIICRNLHDIPAIVRLAQRVGVDYVTLQSSLTDWGKKEIGDYNKSIRIQCDSRELADTVDEALRVASESGVDLRIFNQDNYSKKRKCSWPWKSAFIAANGDVVPCCIIANSDIIRMGNVFEEDFRVIWNSSKYRELRRRIREHDLYDFCRKCYDE